MAALVGGCSGADTPEATHTVAANPSPTTSPDLVDQSELALKMIASDKPGCSAAVGRDGTVVWASARGIADMESQSPLTTASLLDIGSESKQFTATAVLMLVADGRVSIDDPIADYVDGLPAGGTQVTLAELMHHTSGLPDYLGLLADGGFTFDDTITQEQAVDAVRLVDPHFPPGSAFEYSNTNYLLLAEVVMRISGESLAEFLRDRVFAPLDLDMSVAPLGGLPGEAISYEGGGDNFEPLHSGLLAVGDGGIQTTPSELVQWADVYRTGQIGSYQLLDAQFDGAVDTSPGAVISGEAEYGAGMARRPDGSLEHGGLWLAYTSQFRASADRHIAVAVSCNGRLYQPSTIAENLLDVWTG